MSLQRATITQALVLCVGLTTVFLACPKLHATPPSLQTLTESTDGEHPLIPILRYAAQGQEYLEQEVQDYTCVLIKRGRVDGEVTAYQHLEAKIRHSGLSIDNEPIPFSVYLRFLGPRSMQSREVLYVAGNLGGDMLVRRGGMSLPNMTLQLQPTGRLAMKGHRYPITEIGISNLVDRLIEIMEGELQHNDLQVRIYKNAKMNDRLCTHIEVVHPRREKNYRFHVARVFVDNELRVPVYYASYGFPANVGGRPPLLEEYAYSNIRLNAGLTDRDFDRKNVSYGFKAIDQTALGNR